MNNNHIEKLKKQFIQTFEYEPTAIVRAPGRLEILGNHTDYNEGLVLSSAVTQSTYLAIRPNNSDSIRIFSLNIGTEPEIIPLSEIAKKIPGDWKNYIKGVFCEIRKRKQNIGAFDAILYSDVPISSGMSSSAAIEVASCMAIEKAFNLNFSPLERAKIGQGAENNFVGAKTGLLDQFSSIFGKEGHFILCDFRENKVLRNVPFPDGYNIIVVNSMIKHDLVDSDYNRRRESCENVVAEISKHNPRVKALRDLSIEELDSYKDKLNIFDYRKAKHVVEENYRVMKAVEFLDKGDLKSFGSLLFQSHQSSRFNFENSCPQLDYLIELAQSIPGCIGARLSGGGFGGISIHLVESNEADNYEKRIKTAYKIRTGIEPQIIRSNAGRGAELITQ